MKVFKLIFKDALRHKLRAAVNRLITRQAVSFIFPLPYSYKEKIKNVSGVQTVSFANWFGGVYKHKDNFFARMAVDAETIFDVMPEFLITPEELANFKKERNSCVVGAEIAKQYNIKIGDQMTLEGDIYPGNWDFVVRGIYRPKNKNTDATQMLFHWQYVNERMKIETPVRAGDVGWYIVQIKDPNKSAPISNQIDALFNNSSA